ncbi:MAG: ABC-F family ATP-binding cassette domain-containing protein [Clostridiales bacterium]|nr:ABC-F family ATP-binding cassette domain-containing protein [Clostridiales bacterium]
MIVISANNLTKEYDGSNLVLDKVSFAVNKGERIGIIGINGAGKTTLLRMLTGQLPHDGGDFFVSSDLRIGYLEQDGGFDSENTVIEEVNKVFEHFPVMEKEMERLLEEQALDAYEALRERYERMGGYMYQSEIRGILTSMAFDESTYNMKISTLSGGEKTRLALAILLLEKPDILFLDEPTNHLDIGTLKWLEQYLKGYRGTIMIVSHDRYFLNETVNRIFEIERGRLSIYEGNYEFYAAERRNRREVELRHYEKQQKEIERQEEMIRRFKQRGTEKLAKRAASREKRLEAMELMDRPDQGHGKLRLNFRQNFQSGKDVLQADDLSKSFGYGLNRVELFRNVSIDVKRGERICIVGDNGIGKTTLIRMLMGDLVSTTGHIRVGHNVQFGYYDQGQQLLNDSNTVIEELQDAYHLYSEGELRNILGRFLFRGEVVFQEIGDLSGGERARLSLLKLMMSGANTLVLDEPTNHLDIESKEVFEEALLEFPGTCLIVSHDRYFLNRIPTRIMELTENGLVNYLGKYDYYVEKKQQFIESGKKYVAGLSKAAAGGEDAFAPVEEAADAGLSAAEERRLKKEREAEERRLRRRKEALEQEIERLESEIDSIHEELQKPEVMTDHERLRTLSEKMTKDKESLDLCYEQWLELQE